MSIESLRREVEFVLSNTGQPWEAAAALITDFLRTLHELMVRSEDNQLDLLSQIQTCLGSDAMHHLANVINAPTRAVRTYALVDDAPLYRRLTLLCKQRCFGRDDGFNLLSHFIKALDEERGSPGSDFDPAFFLLAFAIGDEAAYHLVGLYTGEQREEVVIEVLGYFNPSLKRFNKLVEMWEIELQQERRALE